VIHQRSKGLTAETVEDGQTVDDAFTNPGKKLQTGSLFGYL